MRKSVFCERVGVLALTGALLLSGCAGGGEDKKGAEASAPAQSAEATPEPLDYSKYNAYLDLTEEIYDIEDVLDAYFSNVDYAPEFALLEGGDYGAIKEVAGDYTPMTYTAEQALDYADEEPAYPDADQAMKALGGSVEETMDALRAIGSYLLFDDYEEDSLAKAPQLHADLWKALEVYDAHYQEFLDAMSALADETREQDLQDLKDRNLMINYYASDMLNAGQDILDNMMVQLDAALAQLDPEAEFALPAMDMTDLSPLFVQLESSYNGLGEALADEEQTKQVDRFTGANGDKFMELFTQKAAGMYQSYLELMNDLVNGEDWGDSFDAAVDACDDMVDAYNNYLV